MTRGAGRLLAVVLGTALAGAVGILGFVRFLPEQVFALRLWIGEHWALSPSVGAASFVIEQAGQPCPESLRSLVVTLPGEEDSRNVPLVSMEIGSHGTTAFAKYSETWSESRSIFIVLDDKRALVEARWDTDYGSFVGKILEQDSSVHLQNQAVCFDLTLVRMDGSNEVEQWLGTIPLQ